MRGEDQHQHFAAMDCPVDLARKRPSRLHVSRRDPATDTGIFKSGTGRIRYRFIL
jgi:hypothetical protein